MEERNLRKTRVGKVVSNKMDKTIVVAVDGRVQHPLYKKIVNRTYKLKAHDENNECNIGDTVRVMETRPLSKDKRWRLVEVIERAKYGGRQNDSTGKQTEGRQQHRRERASLHPRFGRLLKKIRAHR